MFIHLYLRLTTHHVRRRAASTVSRKGVSAASEQQFLMRPAAEKCRSNDGLRVAHLNLPHNLFGSLALPQS
jgi:hypothetical protein